MKILFIGDIFGRPGRDALRKWLPDYRMTEGVDFVIANIENSAGGKGITAKTVKDIARSGVDVMTGGNHSFAQRDTMSLYEEDERILRPANFAPGSPGRGLGIYTTPEAERVAVVSLIGRVFMAAADCPFRAAKELAREARRDTPILIVDFHAEATSEKIAMAFHLDGLATAVIGTHTHVPTADARVSPAGTAALTDVGMTGPFDSIIGVSAEPVLHRFMTGMHARHEVATGDVRICAVLIELDPRTGRAIRAEQVLTPPFRTVRDDGA